MITFLGKVAVVGGLMVVRGRMSLGGLSAFIEYANSIIWPMEILGWLSNDIASAVASWKKIQKVAQERPQIADSPDARPLEGVKGEITFDHVSFVKDGHPILEDVSFQVSPGRTLGIMGMTGSGKTTIVNLIGRFYDVSSGRILVDGQDVQAVTLESLRSQMGVMTQDTFLFTGTVRENLCYGWHGGKYGDAHSAEAGQRTDGTGRHGGELPGREREEAMVRDVDRKGILETGTHQELMAKKGAYYRLYQSQFCV